MIDRLLSPTPKGLKKIRNVAATIAAIAGGIVAVAATGGVALPACIVSVSAIVAAVAGGVAGGAQSGKVGEE